jgi:hypothetical protein
VVDLARHRDGDDRRSSAIAAVGRVDGRSALRRRRGPSRLPSRP